MKILQAVEIFRDRLLYETVGGRRLTQYNDATTTTEAKLRDFKYNPEDQLLLDLVEYKRGYSTPLH